MPGTVICGVDESSPRAVVQVASHLSDRLASSLLLVHVIRGADARGADASPSTAQAELLLSAVAVEENLPASTQRVVRHGAPADQLAHVADLAEAELIVVGVSRKRRLLGRQGAAEALAERARCPVVVVPESARIGERGELQPLLVPRRTNAHGDGYK